MEPTQAQTQPTCDSTQVIPNNTNSQPRPAPLIRQGRPGRAAGSQGYSVQDMVVLAECVSEVLPLGTSEWNEVLSKYNDYASRSGRALRAYPSLRTKFRAIVQQPNPHGSLEDSPRYVQLAKRVAKAIEDRSRLLVSQNPNWAESDEERGVSASVQVQNRSTAIEDEKNQDSAMETNPPTQVEQPTGDLPINPPAAPNQSSEDHSRSSASPGIISTASTLQSVRRSGTSPIRNTTRSAARSLPRLPSTSIHHPPRPNHFSPLGSTSGGGRRGRGTNPIRGVYLEPEGCSSSSSSQREREADRGGLVELYLMKLQEANETIIRLQDESSKSRETNATRLQGLEDENRRLRDSLLQQTVKAECLQGQLEMMGRLWELSKASSFGFFQPVPSASQPPANQNVNPILQPSPLNPMATPAPDNNNSPNLQQQSSNSSLAPSSLPLDLPQPAVSTCPPALHEQHIPVPPDTAL